MPFISHTPESLIARSDSKNPATTCKGITSSGRPCRRSLAASPRNSPSPKGKAGSLAVVSDIESDSEEATAFFCWQHQEQAEVLLSGKQKAKNSKSVELKSKTSIDTLVGRLGVLEVQDNGRAQKKQYNRSGGRHTIPQENLPKQWQDIPKPSMALPEDLSVTEKAHIPSTKPRLSRKRREPSTLNLSFFCCMTAQDKGEALPAPRPRRPEPRTSNPAMVHRPQASQSARSHPSPDHPPKRPSLLTTILSSHTHTLLSLIPPTLSPLTTSALLTELAKPLPPNPEHGYIYIFWLTPSGAATPSAQTASSLLARPSAPSRTTDDITGPFTTTTTTTGSGPAPLMLKIGRAANVQRRLNEWTRQCNYNLSLIRYYPYLPSSPSQPAPAPPFPSPASSQSGLRSESPRKVPHVQRVERLIHLELAEKRVKRLCGGCGREHREWFEVEGSRQGVRGVDEVVRRWVRWGEGLAAGG